MQHLLLHPDADLEVSRISLGFWRLLDGGLATGDLAALIHQALDLGIHTFDHADIYGRYGCEAAFGAVWSTLGIPRAQVRLISKCGIVLPGESHLGDRRHHYRTTAEHIRESAERSLRLLQTDYLDLLLIHRPDPLMDPAEVAEAFTGLRDRGLVRHFGVSNFPAAHLRMLQGHLDLPLVTNQIEYSLLEMKHQDDGVLDDCLAHRMHPMAWSPLAGGRLVRDGAAEADTARRELAAVAGELGCTPAQAALAFVLRHPAGLVPVLGTLQPGHLRALAKALEIRMPREAWFRLWVAAKGHALP